MSELCATCGKPIEDTEEVGWAHIHDGAPVCGKARLRVVPESQRRDPDDCEHEWSAWLLNDFFAAREDRFCCWCGSMEMQTIGPAGE